MNQQNTSVARRQQTAPAQQNQQTAVVANADQVWSGQLTPSQQVAIRTLAREYGLDPLLNHVTILGGKLYIGVEGWLHIANGSPLYDGYELRVLSREEKDALLAGPDDVMFECKAYRKGRRFPGVAYGRANRNNVAAELRGEKLVIEIAQARAIRKALRATFSASELRLPDLGDTDGPSSDGRDYQPFWEAVKALGVSNEEAHRILGVESVKLVADLREAYRAIKAHVQARVVEQRQTPLSKNEFIVAAGDIGFPDQGAIAQALGVRTLREAEKLGSYEELLGRLQAIAASRVETKPEVEQQPPDADDPEDDEELAQGFDEEGLHGPGTDDPGASDDFEREPQDDAESLMALWTEYNMQRARAQASKVKNLPPQPSSIDATAEQVRAATAELGRLIGHAQASLV